MINNERNRQIEKLRKNGRSYREISEDTGLPIGTVKSILSRKNNKEGKKTCKNCGKPLIFTRGKKEKIFCSKKCRLTWWNQHRDQGNKRTYIKRCPTCGTRFETVISLQTYCSHNCYIQSRFKEGYDADDR